MQHLLIILSWGKENHFSCHNGVKDMEERQSGLHNDQVLKIMWLHERWNGNVLIKSWQLSHLTYSDTSPLVDFMPSAWPQSTEDTPHTQLILLM